MLLNVSQSRTSENDENVIAKNEIAFIEEKYWIDVVLFMVYIYTRGGITQNGRIKEKPTVNTSTVNAKSGLKEKIAYGTGDLGKGLMFQMA